LGALQYQSKTHLFIDDDRLLLHHPEGEGFGGKERHLFRVMTLIADRVIHTNRQLKILIIVGNEDRSL